MILSNADIDTICINLMQHFEYENPYLACFYRVLYNTGLRGIEVYNLSNWSINSNGDYVVILSKHNGVRVIASADMPLFFVNNFFVGSGFTWGFSFSYVKRMAVVHCTLGLLFNGDKKINLHLFRHAYCRRLQLIGLNDNDIRLILQHSSLLSTNNYLYDSINTLTFF
jgi:site-specific recombinase XerD